MPGGDRKGPAGGGPRTGRGLGYCSDNDQPGYATNQPAWGSRRVFGWRGRSRSWRNRFKAGSRPGSGRIGFAVNNQEIDPLKAENQELRGVLQKILDKLDKLST